MINFLLFTIFALCLLTAPFLGSQGDLDGALLSGASGALSFCMEIAGPVCLWAMVLELLERCGVTDRLSRLFRPLLSRLFPRAAEDESILTALTENFSANLLGLGNAATPAGIRAAKGMARLYGGKAGDELCLLVVINTASLQLLPSTVAALRAAAGAAAPFDILPAVWLSTLCSLSAGLLAAALLRRIWP